MITPQQAGKVTEDEVKALEAAEQKVDEVLRRDFEGDSVRVYEELLPKKHRVREELFRRYRASGWKMEQKSSSHDPRESTDTSKTWWEFKAAARPVSTGFADQINNPAPPPWQASPSAPPPEWPPRTC